MPPRRTSYPEGTRLFSCPEEGCTYTTPERFLLTRHACTHSAAANARYACPEAGCGYHTGVRSNLTRHALKHTPQRPLHACPEEGCGKTYALAGGLAQHAREQHGSERFPCDQPRCGHEARTPELLREHAFLRHGLGAEAYFTCPDCGHRTVRRKALRLHMAGKLHHRKAARQLEEAARAAAEAHRKAREAEFARDRAQQAGVPWQPGEAPPAEGLEEGGGDGGGGGGGGEDAEWEAALAQLGGFD